MAKKFTLVYGIPLQKFIDVLRKSSIDNKYFNFLQFEKEFGVDSLNWCMLFNEKRECLAAASVQEGYGPTTNSTYINEIQCLKSGHDYGKKMLQLLKKKYTFIWLCANPEVKNDVLLKIYRDPQFNFSEYVVPAKDSIYDVDTHIFGINGRMPQKIWMDFLMDQYGNKQHDKQKTESIDIKSYEPPYTLDQIKANYPSEIYDKLASCPIHKWRAETGIELIHKEPTEEELDRIWNNWQLMPQEFKDKSDEKSIELFGCTNADHYWKLKKEEYNDCHI